MTEKLTLKYDKFASLEFTMIISVVSRATSWSTALEYDNLWLGEIALSFAGN